MDICIVINLLIVVKQRRHFMAERLHMADIPPVSDEELQELIDEVRVINQVLLQIRQPPQKKTVPATLTAASPAFFLTAGAVRHDSVGADYFAFINATVVSSMRLEKPHSLSYQLDTFTRRPPLNLVRVSS